MPQRVKYVGPLDTKSFRGYYFVRDVSDDASGGANAIELPDNIANEALQHRDVFMQWNLPVPQHVKDLPLKRVDAMRKEGLVGRNHWYKRLVIAEMLEDDTPRKRQIRKNEMDGAKYEVDRFEALLREADALDEQVKLENFDPSAPAATQAVTALAGPDAAAEVFKMLESFKEALANANTEKQDLRAELQALKATMERDARLTPNEDVTPPATDEAAFTNGTTIEPVGDAEPAAIDTEAEPVAPANPAAGFPDIFAPVEAPAEPVAAIARRGPGRPPRNG